MSRKSYFFITILVVVLAIIGFGLFVNSQGPKDTGKDRVTNTIPTMAVTPTPKTQTMVINQNTSYQAVLTTTSGKITIDLFADKTPMTANNFIDLAKKNFYNNTIFHRVIEGFMIQGGDPTGTGSGGPGYKFPDEPFTGEYVRGTVAMANSGPNTNGSQFFIMHQAMALPKNYVIFGKVSSGLETVDKIATASVSASFTGEMSVPVNPVKILSVDILETPTSTPSSTPKV